jgi:Cu+-exporting ATPase
VIETIRFPIAGMTCSSCVNRVTRALHRVDGVRRVRVDLGRETATVEMEADVSNSALADAVTAAGYEANITAAIPVEALSPGLLARLFSR